MEILNILQEKTIKNLDLTKFDFTGNPINFAGKYLESVDFSDNKTLKDISFNKAVLVNCLFERSALDSCDFTSAEIKGTGAAKYASFKDAKIYKTKYRNAVIDVCDFRYADIIDCTLQGAFIKYTDFYRTAFKGITVFQDAKIESSSLNYISFETFCITRDNLQVNTAGAALVQENEAVYRDFLGKWIRKDNVKNEMSIITDGLGSKFREAERIYRQLSALWEEKGHNKDAEWAYIQGKRMERKRMLYESKTNKISNKLKAFLSFLMDLVSGYGVSLSKVFIFYLALVMFFGIIYNILTGVSFWNSLVLSVAFTFGVMDAGAYSEVSPIIEGISVFQTGLGMLLTGFMGFIVANKVRKS